MAYPDTRSRRLRENPILRQMLSEHRLSVRDLVQPLFIKEGIGRSLPIASMPGQSQLPIAEAVILSKKLQDAGVPAVLLFGIPSRKDLTGKAAYAPTGIVQKAVRAIKKACPKLLVMTDVCLCEYLSHGHCGHIDGGHVANDPSVETLSRVALSHARAGADVVAPSDMMDGRVAAIRSRLDRAGFESLPLLSYAVKYASAFYAPFREAAQSAPGFGDRSSYQMNAANLREAVREAVSDVEEGADFLLVKPALAYGDVIRRVRDAVHCPVGAYAVSGEYSMIKAAAAKGWIDERRVVLETHLSLKRAGAGFIVTYWAADLARWMRRS